MASTSRRSVRGRSAPCERWHPTSIVWLPQPSCAAPRSPAGTPDPSGNEYWLCARPGIYQLTVKKNLGREQRIGRFAVRQHRIIRRHFALAAVAKVKG